MTNGPIPMDTLRRVAGPLFLDSGIDEAPVGVYGTAFLVSYKGRVFLITAAHLVRGVQAGQVRFLVDEESVVRLPVYQGFGVPAAWSDIDAIVFPADLEDFDLGKSRARALHITPRSCMWHERSHTSRFFLFGHPNDHVEIDYETGRARTGQTLIRGRYVGTSLGEGVHQLRVENPLKLEDFGGLSGSPVFCEEPRLASTAVARFCGMAISGSPASLTVRFLEAAVLCKMMDLAIEHTANHGMPKPPGVNGSFAHLGTSWKGRNKGEPDG